MPIHYNQTAQEFHLQTGQTSYIFTVLKNNQLGHLYYGKKIRHRDDFSRMLLIDSRSNTTSVFEGELEFSLELIKQEYPSYGTTDFRDPAFQITQENGSRISGFEYHNHKVVKGKPLIHPMPAAYAEEEDAVTLEVILRDPVTHVELILSYSVFEQENVITRHVRFINRGDESICINRAMSLSVDFPDADYEMVQLSGSWARERHVEARQLRTGVQSISSARGISGAQHNPFLALKRPETTEQQGEVYGFSFVYSGNFLAQAEVDHYDVTRVIMGLNPFDFRWVLESGEEFQTPEVVMVRSDDGLNGMSQIFHRLFQNHLVRGFWKDKERPVLMNNWEGTYFDFNEEKILQMAEAAKKVGVELFVLDDGWFGKRDDDTTSLGDWFVDKEKLPNGITGLAEKVNDLGLDFGLWFEPEMISKISRLYDEHPDWLLQVPDRRLSHGRHQFILDFSRREVVDYIFSMMAEILREAPITYVKWDMNRAMTEIGSLALPHDRQQETAHRYVMGVYDLYDRLTSEFPRVLFESCASGGCRFDPGMLYYAPQTWTSDNTDAVERLKIQYGTSMVYPLSTMGAHVSEVPNHQVNRVTSLKTRANVAYFGMFGYELDITTMTQEELDCISSQVAFYKENRGLVQRGTFYRIESPFEGNVTSWNIVSKDQAEVLVGRYLTLARANDGYHRLKLKGLDETRLYRIEGYRDAFYGDELMNAGLLVENYLPVQGDFESLVLKLIQVKE
ncbi:alpha-galactosidase [Alteribacillus sp. HJP-4]|uniref:alpha-galactosidase n=1 Tax=Alteribacillus sp. HJP-4 TaxID=2775394 RepID=UPI0035CD2BE8